MTTYSFNLIDREWIWGVWRKDSRRELISLYTALTCSHELREIHGDTPLETAALHRLLLTVLYRVYNQDDEWADNWGKIWHDQRFVTAKIIGYLRRDDIYPHFDLFHQKRPFYQTISDWEKSRWQTVSDLRPHYASGDDVVLFDHRNKHAGVGVDENEKEAGTVLMASEAARALVSLQAFGLGGTKGRGLAFSDAPCARGVVFLLEGNTLFETLMLNFFPVDLENHSLPNQKNDKAAWEMDDPFIDDPKRPYGYLDYATWQNRKVLLLPEGDPANPMVRQMRYFVGMKQMIREPLNPLMSLRMPQAGKRKGSKKSSDGASKLRFSKEKALWRDSTSLFAWYEEHQQGHRPLRALEWMGSMAQMGHVESQRQYFFGAYGLCSKPGKDKAYFFRAERFPLPVDYLKVIKTDIAKELKLALQRAEDTAKILSLYGALGTFACHVLGMKEKERFKKGNKERVADLVQAIGAERYFWSRLEVYFVRLVQDLPDHADDAVEAWNDTLRQLARQGLEQAARMAGGTRALRAYGVAANDFEFQLYFVFNPRPTQEEREEIAQENQIEIIQPRLSRKENCP